MKHAKIPVHFEHYTNPMVHPVTGETILSYKKLMNDPATAKVWQTAFGKDFGGMAQGDNKTGQKSTNTMFVMSREPNPHHGWRQFNHFQGTCICANCQPGYGQDALEQCDKYEESKIHVS
jgi:hypothetical protein